MGAAIALRAHLYLRRNTTALARTFADMLTTAVWLAFLPLALLWVIGFLVAALAIITSTAPPGFTGQNLVGGPGLIDGIIIGLMLGAAAMIGLVAVVYVGYRVIVGFFASLESAVEFAYLYPEEWWITNPGRDARDDTYRAEVPWISPLSEAMDKFRSRASGK